MPSLGFKKEFADAVKSGAKRQTIRFSKARSYHVGDRIFCFSGLKTAHVKKLGEFTIVNVEKLYFAEAGGIYFPVLNGKRLSCAQADELAIADGFDNWGEMLAWFLRQYSEEVKNAEFQVIKW